MTVVELSHEMKTQSRRCFLRTMRSTTLCDELIAVRVTQPAAAAAAAAA